MSSEYIGIEDARKRLGDLVTAAQQGADIVLTRNGRPVARLAAYKEPRMLNLIYTVEIQASNADRTIWQAMHPAETVTTFNGDSAVEIARSVAMNQDIAEGANWRICVWEGRNADTGLQPAYIHYGAVEITIADLAQEIGDAIATPERVARFAGCLSEYDPRTGRLPKPWYGKGMAATFTRDEADELIGQWIRASRATDGFTDLLDGTEPIEQMPNQWRA